MSNLPSNSPNKTKNSTTIGSMCPSNSESFGQSGLADTSAGSGNVSSNAPLTARAQPTGQNDLGRSERKGAVPQQNQPASCTNVTFENTNASTASQLCSSNGKPLNQKSPKSDSTRTAIPISAKIQVTVDVQISAGETSRAGADKQNNMPTVSQPSSLNEKPAGFEAPNATFPHTNKSTATQLSSVGQPLAFEQKSGFSESMKTGIPMPNNPRSPAQQIEAIKRQQQMDEAVNSKKSIGKSKRSQKSVGRSCGRQWALSQKSMRNSGKSGKSLKSRRNGIIYCPSLKSKKSKKSRKVVKKGCQNTSVHMPGVVDDASNPSMSQKPQKVQNRSVYMYDVMDDNATKPLNNPAALQKLIKSPNNRIPIPRADKFALNMNQVAPTTPIARAPSYCVYDVSELSAAQRRLPPPSTIGNRNLSQRSQRCPMPTVNRFSGAPAASSVPAGVGTRPGIPQAKPTATTPATNTKIHGLDTIQNSQGHPESVALPNDGPPAPQALKTRAAPTTTTTITIYGKNVDKSQSSQKLSQPVIPPMAEAPAVKRAPAAPSAPAPVVLPSSITPAQSSPQPAATANSKIVIFGKTADGKNTIQMTIDMQIVAGEALGGSDKPIQVIPQKILIAGKEFTLDGFSNRGDTPPQ